MIGWDGGGVQVINDHLLKAEKSLHTGSAQYIWCEITPSFGKFKTLQTLALILLRKNHFTAQGSILAHTAQGDGYFQETAKFQHFKNT